ncbi:branched-chain amino acid ABC transporter permease [Hypericibacter adhaerens]|jgi:branched-chain amino acid transport system permease protein|uniref:Branched-chain amino acid ABC transporter permease n=1 Tax=Hypericibacter adhaerens TaxID=2602016 RepID=A0A5J6N5U3_9PROT|nr:branched-chain amino acid ABC transporter permease [Hypericibacter adhaerens]QEX25231.1 branched-chain amino acid ABC transporter permease [Hypericibacter adhaerens]
MQFLVDTLLNAAMASAATALVSIGLALIFGVMRIENFAHGELYMVGAYVTWYVTAGLGLNYFAGLAGAVAVTALIGAFMEVALFRRLRSNPVGCLIVTVGVLLVLQTAMVWLFGINSTLLVDTPFPGVLKLGAVNLPWHRLFVIFAAIAVMGALSWLLRGTRFGWAIRAAAQDREAASLQGISIGRIAVYAIMLSAGLAGAAGSLMAPLVRISPFMGQPIIITAFIVVIMGGIGSIEGAIIASVVYSTFYTFVSAYIDSTIAIIAGLCIMLGVLIFMPSGLLGKAEKV